MACDLLYICQQAWHKRPALGPGPGYTPRVRKPPAPECADQNNTNRLNSKHGRCTWPLVAVQLL